MTKPGIDAEFVESWLGTSADDLDMSLAEVHRTPTVSKKSKKKPKKKKPAKAQRRATTKGGAEPISSRVVSEQVEAQATLPLNKIKPRANPPTRGLDPLHIVELAESIQDIGVVTGITIDANQCLVAGGHRLGACRVLAASEGERVAELLSVMRELSPNSESPSTGEWSERLIQLKAGPGQFDPAHVPVVFKPFDSSKQKELALAIEASENEKRRDYSKKEVLALWGRLEKAGYKTTEGRARKGERRALGALSKIIGKSERTVQRLLANARAEQESTTYVVDSELKDRAHLRHSAQRYLRKHSANIPKARQKMIEEMLQGLE